MCKCKAYIKPHLWVMGDFLTALYVPSTWVKEWTYDDIMHGTYYAGVDSDYIFIGDDFVQVGEDTYVERDDYSKWLHENRKD